MYGWYVALSVVAVLCIAAWYSDIKMVIMFKKTGNDERIIFRIRMLYGLIRYELNVPMVRFFGWMNGFAFKLNRPDKESKKHKLTMEDLKEFYHRMQVLLKFTDGLKQWAQRSLSHLHCTRLKWTSHIGVGEAPETAIAVGLAWAIKSCVIGFILNRIRWSPFPQEINVVPQYNMIHFSTHFTADAQIRLGHALVDAVILLIRIIRVRHGLKTWKNTFLKPDPTEA